MDRNVTGQLWPLAVYSACVFIVVVLMVGLSFLLGQRRRNRRAGDEPYESGIVPSGDAGIRFTARFYLPAALFLVFDMETVFVLTGASAVRELGWQGYAAMVSFIGMLAAALVYLWRSGALDWASKKQRAPKKNSEQEVRTDASSR